MLHDVNNKTEILELLDQELRCDDEDLKDHISFKASLVRDLDKAIIQMQMSFLEGRI